MAGEVMRRTSAPCSASERATTGPAMTWPRSSTRSASRGRTFARAGSGSLSAILMTSTAGKSASSRPWGWLSHASCERA
ncbi:hypothetical protein G6F22_021419 [Rhizopus arrhizus]|nr:hypothetical protein G6F22_021419 [Rhizopus arrhizus]